VLSVARHFHGCGKPGHTCSSGQRSNRLWSPALPQVPDSGGVTRSPPTTENPGVLLPERKQLSC
jgi:hypothetical protein